jgi:hypothetical protein
VLPVLPPHGSRLKRTRAFHPHGPFMDYQAAGINISALPLPHWPSLSVILTGKEPARQAALVGQIATEGNQIGQAGD